MTLLSKRKFSMFVIEFLLFKNNFFDYLGVTFDNSSRVFVKIALENSDYSSPPFTIKFDNQLQKFYKNNSRGTTQIWVSNWNPV